MTPEAREAVERLQEQLQESVAIVGEANAIRDASCEDLERAEEGLTDGDA